MMKQGGRMWTRISWLTILPSGGSYEYGIEPLAPMTEWLLASQEVLQLRAVGCTESHVQ
jgi:hypothetical protein